MPEEQRPRDGMEDDGRTIASMNVEGMPWYVPGRADAPEATPESARMTREERRAYIWAAVRSGLLILLVFALAFFLFLLFCDFVWFR